MNLFNTLLLIHLDRGDLDAQVVQSDEVKQRYHQNTKIAMYSETLDK